MVALTTASCGDTTGGSANPDGSGDALAGEVIEFVVPYDPGGGYDQYVRMIAPVLADCLDAEVVPTNEPGAGSLLATSKTAIAPPDGTRIQIHNAPGVIGAQVANAEGVQFDLGEFSWLGRVAAEPDVVSVAADSEFDDFQDLIDAGRTLRFAATGPGSNEYVDATVLSDVYGFDADVVTGFEGSEEARASVLQGDTDAHIQTLDSAFASIDAGDLRPLALIDSESSETVPDVPTVYEYPPPDESRRTVLDGLVDLVHSGRPISAGPDLPEDTLATLRDGLQCALADKGFLAKAKENHRPVDTLSGEKTASLVGKALDPAPELADLVEQSF